MKRRQVRLVIVIMAYVVLFILLHLFINWAYADPRMMRTYIPDCPECVELYEVVRGDTLAGIARRKLGNWRKWRMLVEINNLKILPNNLVIIKPGQILKLEQHTQEGIAHYRETTRAFIEDWILRVKKLNKVPAAVVLSHLGRSLMGVYQPSGSPNEHFSVYKAIEYHKQMVQVLRVRAAKLYADQIYWRAVMMGVGDYPSLRGEWWQRERQAALLLLAMGWQESTYRYVPGEHGELGWFQIKPMTAYLATKEMWVGISERDAIDIIKRKLMDDPKFVMVVVGRILKDRKTMTDALANGYNRGNLKYHYAQEVLKKYRRLVNKMG